MKYDDASWHSDGDFPPDLRERAGATHIAMFVSWAMLNGLAGDLHTSEFPDDLAKLSAREVTPVEWFLSVCDGKFTDEDLNDEGNRFTKAYYAGEAGLHTTAGSYLADYDDTFSSSETLYHVPDGWGTLTTIGPIIAKRFSEWRRA